MEDPLVSRPSPGASNWLTGRPYSAAYRKAAPGYYALPVYRDSASMEAVVRGVREARVTVVESGTGSGKTVVLPKLALKYGAGKDGVVVVTNPKSSIARGNAEYAALTLEAQIGQEVGYAFRGSPAGSLSQKSRLIFMTDGFLSAQSRSDPLFSRYAVVVVDEAHERTVPIDDLLFRLRRAMQARPDLRVLIISATIDTRIFTRYFQDLGGLSCRVVSLFGAPRHPVRVQYLSPTEGRSWPRARSWPRRRGSARSSSPPTSRSRR